MTEGDRQGQDRTERDVKHAVVDRYGARARQALAGAGVAATSAECCAPADGPAPLEFVDLGSRATSTSSVAGDTAAAKLYDPADVSALPDSVTLASAGCGNPLAIAELRPGESVLDLGSGGGIDCFLAARQVGARGEVWGLDMTPDMVALARHNTEQVGLANVRFRLGEIEDIPFADGTFDVIMSNCVINLSTDKPRVFAEAFRVLKPGGRLRVSDMVWTREVPADVRADLDAWAGCIAGAPLVEDYLAGLRAAGFIDVAAEYTDTERGIVSASIRGAKPA